MLHCVRFAEIYGINLFVIGNELAGLTVHEEEWRELIAAIRKIYNGHVTYAAQWEKEFLNIKFWDLLDYIGVNFYFPISGPNETPEAGSPEMSRGHMPMSR